MKSVRIIASLVVALATVGVQAQTTTYDWTLTGSTVYNGEGTITVDSIPGASLGGGLYNYPLTAITGELNGNPISELNSGRLEFDAATAPTTSLESLLVEFNIVATSGVEYTISGSPANTSVLNNGNFEEDTTGTFALTSAVPEPGTLALVTMGGLGLAAWRRRK